MIWAGWVPGTNVASQPPPPIAVHCVIVGHEIAVPAWLPSSSTGAPHVRAAALAVPAPTAIVTATATPKPASLVPSLLLMMVTTCLMMRNLKQWMSTPCANPPTRH